MKPFLSVMIWLLPFITSPQSKDSLSSRQIMNPSQQVKPEIFTNGFIDIMNNGQLNASARFIRLFIGEPGKFGIPLSIYSGVSANNFQGQPSPMGQVSNDHLFNAFINPLSGMVNMSSAGILF